MALIVALEGLTNPLLDGRDAGDVPAVTDALRLDGPGRETDVAVLGNELGRDGLGYAVWPIYLRVDEPLLC